MRHKYKGYVIEPCYKEDSNRADYFVAKSESNSLTFEKKTLRECKEYIDTAEEWENYFLGALEIARRRR
tara:strand:+ start:927 stop:1133 length:207 start_codon:yes stop_codon:yes gene_type:complete